MRQLSPALRTDLITGVAVTIIGVVYYIATFWIQETSNIVTPRTFPAIVGIVLILLGLFLVGQALYRGRKLAAGQAEAVAGDAAVVSGAGVRSEGGPLADGPEPGSADVEGAGGDNAAGVVLDAPADPPSKKVVLQFALFFVYLAILIPVGFLLSTAAFLMTMTSIYAPDRWIRNLIFSVLFSVVVYAAFVYGLAVYLPVGIVG